MIVILMCEWNGKFYDIQFVFIWIPNTFKKKNLFCFFFIFCVCFWSELKCVCLVAIATNFFRIVFIRKWQIKKSCFFLFEFRYVVGDHLYSLSVPNDASIHIWTSKLKRNRKGKNQHFSIELHFIGAFNDCRDIYLRINTIIYLHNEQRRQAIIISWNILLFVKNHYNKTSVFQLHKTQNLLAFCLPNGRQRFVKSYCFFLIV